LGPQTLMTRKFMIKYVRIDSRGNYKYRRRVPAKLQPALGKKEFVKLLGTTDTEAMQNYGPYHEHIEKLLTLTQPVSGLAELLAVKAALEVQFIEVQADPFSSGRSDDERLARSETIEGILQTYPLDPMTGYPDPQDMSLKDSATVKALQSGVHAVSAQPTIKNAFNLYLAERDEPDDKKKKSLTNRVRRIERELLKIVGQDVPLSELRREHARKLRDQLKAQKRSKTPDSGFVKLSAVKRNLGIAKTVVNFAIREYDC